MSRNLILTLACLGISIFLLKVGFWKQQLREDTIKEKNAVIVTITEVDFYAAKSFSALSFKYNGTNNSVNLSRSLCNNYKVGDQIKVYYNADNELFLMKNSGLENDENMMASAGILCCIASVGYLLWVAFFKNYYAIFMAWKNYNFNKTDKKRGRK